MTELVIKMFKSPNTVTSLVILLLTLLFACLPDTFFPLLCLDRAKLVDGQLWRLLTGNFVHFGWAHSLMNLAAFSIFAFTFGQGFSRSGFIALVLVCCFAVSVGVYLLNPEYEVYAGLSGAIHGFFVAGFLQNKRHSTWLNGVLVAALFGKIFIEQQPGYQATELQSLLPVAVAYDAHLYGALAGLVFGGSLLLIDKYVGRREPGSQSI